MAKLHVDKWEKHAFMGKLIMSTWIDNFFVMARSLRGGMEVMQDAETYLRNRWNLSFKVSSKLVMLPKDHAEEEDAEGWTCCIHVLVLGHIVEFDGNVALCVNRTLRSAWASFYANVSKSACRARRSA